MTATSRSWSAPGSSASAAEALEAHRGEIYAWARRIVGGHEDALDVVQDVCLRCVGQWAAAPPDHVRGWLRRVTVNRAIDLARLRRARVDPAAAARAAAPGPAAAGGDERRRLLLEALHALSDQQRHALLAKVLDDRSFAQIADEMDVAVPTVKTHYLRAVRALRDRLRAFSRSDCDRPEDDRSTTAARKAAATRSEGCARARTHSPRQEAGQGDLEKTRDEP